MKQYGTVLVFKPEVPEADIRAAMDKLAPMLEDRWMPEDQKLWRTGKTVTYRLEPFDSDSNGPVWYIP